MAGMKESQQIEFKSSWRDEYMRILCGFANSNGGILYLGMSDKGTPIGLKNIDKLLEDIPNKIRNYLGIIPSVEREIIGDKEVIKIEISPSEIPISYDGKFYIRAGSTTQEVKGGKLIRMILRKKNITWDSLPSDADISEIDEETVELFRKMAKDRLAINKGDSVEKILENLELIKEGKLTNAGVLLFGKNPQRYFLNSTSRVGRFKTSTEIIDSIDIKGNLFKQVEELVSAIKKHINVRFEIKDIRREEIWDYPIPAIREACINALIHRDYLDPAEIQIRVYDDRIWFWNPGELPEGITVEMLKTEHASKPRNKLIATVFYYAGLIERWGTGTKRMVELCREQGLPEPEFKEFGGGFSVIFYKDIYNEEYLRKLGLNERQIKAVLYVKEKGKISNTEYQKLTGVKKRQATDDLRGLENIDILQRVGKTGKGVYYTLKGHQRGEMGTKGAPKGHNEQKNGEEEKK